MSERTPRSQRLPGDLTREQLVERIIRVDQAGEYGAVRIYEGQLAVLGGTASGAAIRTMAAGERKHLETFDKMMVARRVRPTVLQPLWHVAGYALGVATAMLGPQAAMACTEAVEEVIDEHYARQVAVLGDDEAELREICERYRQEEVEHGETAVRLGARDAAGYRPLTAAIRAGSRAAIWLAERF